MNKLLVAVFDNETAAGAGLNALRTLHAAGDITLYATGVLARDAEGMVSVKKSMDAGPIGAVTGLAVGSLVGLLGGPVGVAVGAVAGTAAGAVRDFWAAGVGLDFIEAAIQQFGHERVEAVLDAALAKLADLIDASHAALLAANGRAQALQFRRRRVVHVDRQDRIRHASSAVECRLRPRPP